MATQNDDLDLQTFQIYHENEEDVKAAQEKAEQQITQSMVKNKKGKTTQNKNGLFSFSFKNNNSSTKKNNQAPTKVNKKIQPIPKSKNQNKFAINDSTKGVIIGFLILGLFIALDQFGFFKF